VGNSNGITVIGNGRLSGRSGSGSFRQSDGRVGFAPHFLNSVTELFSLRVYF
jgi:hypothetical protein